MGKCCQLKCIRERITLVILCNRDSNNNNNQEWLCEGTDRPILLIGFGEIFQLFSIVLRSGATQKLKSIAMATLSVNANKFLSRNVYPCVIYSLFCGSGRCSLFGGACVWRISFGFWSIFARISPSEITVLCMESP